ncbi:MAG TPA: minichromosome maintenance protein MCM, partial [Euryarchaeota archaeon]|nr:minichromosome maintenance protein MCM [Euryarchaeota archaeon]
HMGKFLSIRGLIKKTVEVRPRVLKATFQCERCKEISIIEQDDTQRLKEPFKCEGCERTQASTDFRILVERSVFVDSQKIELEELPEELEGGARAERLTIYVKDDMTGTVNPGETVVINGILMSQPQRNKQGAKSPTFEIFLEANSIDPVDTDFSDIKPTPEETMDIIRASKDARLWENMTHSISPSIKGYDSIKEALILQLFGGVPKEQPDGQRVRGDIHLLLLGDPGTAKSQLLRYMSRLAPRGRYTQGRASSAAGLTAAAVRDEFGEGRWSLEAGALVLADNGLACVDELDKMEKSDASSLHEAMEQQTVTITKAGINATLQARCSMLAAANPKDGRFSQGSVEYLKQVPANVTPALLTRFDVIFTIPDEPDVDVDRDVSSHILKSHLLGEAIAREKEGDSSREVRKVIDDNKPDLTVPFDTSFLRKYVSHSKKYIIPIMSDEAMKKIQDFYLELRNPVSEQEKKTGNRSISITARKLEALVRLAEASARVRLSDVVT